MKGMRKLSKDSREQLCSHEGFPEERLRSLQASLQSRGRARASPSLVTYCLRAEKPVSISRDCQAGSWCKRMSGERNGLQTLQTRRLTSAVPALPAPILCASLKESPGLLAVTTQLRKVILRTSRVQACFSLFPRICALRSQAPQHLCTAVRLCVAGGRGGGKKAREASYSWLNTPLLEGKRLTLG